MKRMVRPSSAYILSASAKVMWKKGTERMMRSLEKMLYSSAQILVQSTLVISKSKGPSKTVRDIRTSTYQICSIEDKTI